MKIFITGATGYIGSLLALRLAGSGKTVHALVRDPRQTQFLEHSNIKLFQGDITNAESLRGAVEGCEQVYHVAALVKSWMKDTSVIYKTNVDGAKNVLEEAICAGVKKIVFTSTCGVIGPSLKDPMTEKDPRIIGYSLDYELSKKMAEDMISQYVKNGVNAVIVSPSKVYGPGRISHSLTYNGVIKKFLQSGVAFIPYPGHYQGCFAYIDDVVNGHIRAMEKGLAGEKYILGGVNISYRHFFEQIKKIQGKGRIIEVSKFFIRAFACWQWVQSWAFHKDPLFGQEAVNHFYCDYIFSSQKAISELGYHITPLEEGIQKTVQFLNQNNHE